jgi:ferrous iron transport protein A
VIRLSEIRVGEQGRVRRVDGTDWISQRLMEMGLTAGTRVRLLGSAPLGDPLELELRGYRLSIRRAEAQRVELEVDSQAAGETS